MKCEIHGTTLKTYRTDQLGDEKIREKYCPECNPQSPESPPQTKIRTIEKTESDWKEELREYRERIEDLERELKPRV